MKFDDAVLLLKDAAYDSGYSINQIRSKSRDLWVVKSMYGLAYCTRDWPAPYKPSKEDKEAEDWELYEGNRETPLKNKQ